MTENLHTDLENLRKEVAEKGHAPVILSQAALEQHFHGLTLGQIVKLTDAPTLATIADVHMPDGMRTERFCIDGKDPELCHAVARHFLLDPTTFAPGHIREVKTCDDDVVRETMVRDHGVIYRVTPHEAIVDESLTRTLQTLRRRDAYSRSDVGSTPQFTAEESGTSSVDEAAACVLQSLKNMRTCNAAARCIVAQLVRSTGEQDLETALAAADPEILQTAFRQVLASSDEIEVLLDGLTTQTNDLLQAAREAQASATSRGPMVVPPPAGERMPMDSLRPPV